MLEGELLEWERSAREVEKVRTGGGKLLEWGRIAGMVSKVRAGEGNCWSGEEVLER